MVNRTQGEEANPQIYKTLAGLDDLRVRLYQCTQLRAEEIPEINRREWLVDVFEGKDDPVLEIIEKITLGGGTATALGLAGGSGVGKTMQIYRLIDQLWDRHKMIGIRVGYEDYSSLSSPPDITDFLLSIIGGLADMGRKQGHMTAEWGEEKLEQRFLGLLKRLKFEPEDTAGPIKATASLREDESFRRRIRVHLAGQVAQLVKEIRSFASSIVSDIHGHQPECRGVVMIIDSTERLSASALAERDMQEAVRSLFIQNGDNLRFEDLHSIYLLPAWLPISDGGALRLDTVTFPTIRVSNRDGSDAESGITLLDQIVRRRMPEIDALLAQSDLRDLYCMSGGVQRVLFLLLKEVAQGHGKVVK